MTWIDGEAINTGSRRVVARRVQMGFEKGLNGRKTHP
jgi:hypothetical protein